MNLESGRLVTEEPEPAVPSDGALMIEIAGMTKRFGDLVALDNVSFEISPGTVHALLGENGAGKSTLVKCIMGYYLPDHGGLLVDGREQEIRNPRHAQALGLGMVYQHFTLVPNMLVLENLVMARADVPAKIDWRRERERIAAFLEDMPFSVDIEQPVTALAAGEKQKVEILKQLYLNSRFLILDEPTSVLTPGEADEILGLVRDMAHDGKLTVLLITHKFREVTGFADDVSVLRHGEYVGGGSVADLSVEAMSRMMIGTDQLPEGKPRKGDAAGDIRLDIQELKADNDGGLPAVRGLNLQVRSGEIVGIAGVSGNGQAELVQVLAGQRDKTGGEVQLHGTPYRATREEMARHKIFCLPEEPLRNACVPNMSVADNMAFRSFDRPPFAAGGWWRNKGAVREAARALVARYNVKTPSVDAPIRQLSGGNVQRAVLARELGGDVEILVAANPCFGLDFAAVHDIHGQILTARDNGAAILLVSEDLDELLELSDRIVVMSEGRLVFETAIADADRTTIGRHMAGHETGHDPQRDAA